MCLGSMIDLYLYVLNCLEYHKIYKLYSGNIYMVNLENITKKEESFLKKAFKEESTTMWNHLIACGTAIGASTGFSYIAPSIMKSDAEISGIATILDMTGYWGSFLPQLLYRDREKIKNNKGQLDKTKILKKTGEYLSYVGIVEGTYATLRFIGQYYLQKKGWDPATASFTIQMTGTVAFTVLWPILRYSTRKWSEK